MVYDMAVRMEGPRGISLKFEAQSPFALHLDLGGETLHIQGLHQLTSTRQQRLVLGSPSLHLSPFSTPRPTL